MCHTCAVVWRLAVVLVLVALPVSLRAGEQLTFVVHGPTVVAFFPPVTKADLKDGCESLADFQFYNPQISQMLQKEGIDFREVYALSFRIRIGAKVTTFRTRKIQVGYYFIAPSKKPRVEYGVLGFEPIDIAHEYFVPIAK
jgi:hypothetical protein